MPRSRAPLWRRSEASSYLVRSPSTASGVENMNSIVSGGCSTRRKRSKDAPALDVLSLAPSDDSSVVTATPVTSAGVFVTPSPILATLSTSEWLMLSRNHCESSHPSSMEKPLSGVIITAEVGGWLRVREQRNGTIRYQRRLRYVSNPSCLCWSLSFCGIFFVGQQCGLVTMLQLKNESIIEVADCVLHEAPIVAMVRVFVNVRGGANGSVAVKKASGTAQELLLTLDTNGVLAAWKTADLCCLQTVLLSHPPFRCLTSDESLPGCVFVPGGIEGALAADGGGGGVFDIMLLEYPHEVGAAWRCLMTYGGMKAAVISMTLAPRHSSPGMAQQLTLWGGTENGAIYMWDVGSGTLLRRVDEVTPSCSPIHYLYCAPHMDPRHMWVCTRGGSVTLWDTSRLMMLSELPVSYPKGPAVSRPSSRSRHLHSGGSGTDADTCFLRHLVSDASEAPSHFTLFVRPIEPVVTLRLWAAATDGTVRSLLCQTNLSALPVGEKSSTLGALRNTSLAAGAVPASVMDHDFNVIEKETVRVFIEGKARLFVEETTALRNDISRLTREVAALQVRNRVLADALKKAIGRIATRTDDDNDVSKKKPHVDSPLSETSLPRVTGETPHTDSIRVVLKELHGRLQDAFDESEQLAAEKMALRLQLTDQTQRPELSQEGPAALTPVNFSQHEAIIQVNQTTVKCLQEELAMCQEASKSYMHHWREEQVRREAAERECELCKQRLLTLENELGRARTLLSVPAVDAAGGQNNTCQTVQDESIDGGRELEKLAFCSGALSGRIDASIEAAAAMHELESARKEILQRERWLVEAQERLQEMRRDVQRSREAVDAKAAESHRTQQRLVERESILLEHAERLCVLEEELRRKERRLLAWRGYSR
ncbi:hypothetical protein MOQ_006069 [Trypanosoma cruzi marinkellei]|uniref:Uncharacterized protein n=1 Tax=Trypanosoma cruzi marinkellei TaxID=85056 RepID=K2M5J6_TRYCR|nr:hypothetical protein MOQ_006069 [Trypanosoma cruzi marinkellei]